MCDQYTKTLIMTCADWVKTSTNKQIMKRNHLQLQRWPDSSRDDIIMTSSSTKFCLLITCHPCILWVGFHPEILPAFPLPLAWGTVLIGPHLTLPPHGWPTLTHPCFSLLPVAYSCYTVAFHQSAMSSYQYPLNPQHSNTLLTKQFELSKSFWIKKKEKRI